MPKTARRCHELIPTYERISNSAPPVRGVREKGRRNYDRFWRIDFVVSRLAMLAFSGPVSAPRTARRLTR